MKYEYTQLISYTKVFMSVDLSNVLVIIIYINKEVDVHVCLVCERIIMFLYFEKLNNTNQVAA